MVKFFTTLLIIFVGGFLFWWLIMPSETIDPKYEKVLARLIQQKDPQFRCEHVSRIEFMNRQTLIIPIWGRQVVDTFYVRCDEYPSMSHYRFTQSRVHYDVFLWVDTAQGDASN
jgi:hypothetical protein